MTSALKKGIQWVGRVILSVVKPAAASLLVKKAAFKNPIRSHSRLNFTSEFKFVLLWKSALYNVTQKSPRNSAIRPLFTDF